jgi:sulfonate dioxygenase
MAPFLEESSIESHIQSLPIKTIKSEEVSPAIKYVPGRASPPVSYENYEHGDLRPRFPDVHWEPYVETPHTDKGLLGDENFSNLLASATDVYDYTPKIGTEISGIRLSQLTDAQKNDLARLIATRGVVFFRNQDDLDIDAQRELGKYFGTLHKHATTAVPQREGLEDVHVVYAAEDSKEMRAVFTPTFLWHSDVSLPFTLFLATY